MKTLWQTDDEFLIKKPKYSYYILKKNSVDFTKFHFCCSSAPTFSLFHIRRKFFRILEDIEDSRGLKIFLEFEHPNHQSQEKIFKQDMVTICNAQIMFFLVNARLVYFGHISQLRRKYTKVFYVVWQIYRIASID